MKNRLMQPNGISAYIINGAALALLTLISCSAGGAVNAEPQDMALGNQAGQLSAVESSLPGTGRLAADAGEFLYGQPGADFAADLPVSNCTVAGDNTSFTPSWTAPSFTGLENASYRLYRLLLDAQPTFSSLTLAWANPPTLGDCWIGLFDWNTNSWDFKQLPSNNELYLPDVSAYSGTGQHCYAAVVVLGTAAAELASISFPDGSGGGDYVIVDTGQTVSYDDGGNVVSPSPGEAYYGQDADYDNAQPAYIDNGDGTITDLNTGLMWAKTPNNLEKMTWDEIFPYADSLILGGHDDWRVPTIKELYSLILFTGETGMSEFDSIPYIDDTVFDFEYGDESAGERFIDAQYWSSTEYVSTTMGGDATTFGVNFADGRIKGYGRSRHGPVPTEMEQFIRCVRGNPEYGVNDFVDNGDGTITDSATGMTWMQIDSGHLGAGDGSGLMNWKDALDWAENLDYAGETDWRLPSAKELQSIVDYTRSPATTASAAIDPLFDCTAITDEGGGSDYGFYWTSTTHLDGPPETRGDYAAYVAFGEALGFMEMPPGSGSYQLLDVHGAGAQRSDPKDGDPADYPFGHGPQGDVIRIFNLARCVRGGLSH